MPAAKKKSTAPRRSISNVTSVCRDEDEQLAKAIRASRAAAQEEEADRASLKYALEQSQKEREEAETLMLAMQASLLTEQQRLAAIGLGLQSTTQLVDNMLSPFGRGPGSAGCTTSVLKHCGQTVLSQSNHLLKVTFGGDVRRLHVQWCSNARVGEVFASLQRAIESGFGCTIDQAHVLKYYDSEGDFCTLVEDTVLDFLDISAERNSLRLFVDVPIGPRCLSDEMTGAEHAKTILTISSNEQSKEAAESFLIATPPLSPRMHMTETSDNDYEALWAIVDSCP